MALKTPGFGGWKTGRWVFLRVRYSCTFNAIYCLSESKQDWWLLFHIIVSCLRMKVSDSSNTNRTKLVCLEYTLVKRLLYVFRSDYINETWNQGFMFSKPENQVLAKRPVLEALCWRWWNVAFCICCVQKDFVSTGTCGLITWVRKMWQSHNEFNTFWKLFSKSI